jgi:tRNA (guanine-N7-)-methyltransferase
MGKFIQTLSQLQPGETFLAVEKEPNAIVVAAEGAQARKIENLHFLMGDALVLGNVLPALSVAEIYLNFVDPWPKPGGHVRRLTGDTYVPLYEKLLTKTGTLTLKTDHESLFEYTKEILLSRNWRALAQDRDLPDEAGNIKTEYESKFRAIQKPIYYLQFQRPQIREEEHLDADI